jgi:hypothetical protein
MNINSAIVGTPDQVKRNLEISLGMNPDEIQKGEITDAFQYNSPIGFQKTGKEIIEKLEASYMAKVTEFAAIKAVVDNMVELLPETPTSSISEYSKNNMVAYIDTLVPYKTFDWDKTYYREDSDSAMSTNMSSGVYASPVVSQSQDSCKICKNWNNAIHNLLSVALDLGTITTIKNNINPSQTFSLDLRQLKTLGF